MRICPTLDSVGNSQAFDGSDEQMCTNACMVKNHALFCCMAVEGAQRLIKRAKHIHIPSHRLIYREGDEADKFYLIVKGSVKLFRPTQEGGEHIIDIVRSGHLLAESEIFDQTHQYHYFAEALQTTQMIGFSTVIFREIISRDIDASRKLLAYFSDSLKRKNYDLEVMINCPAKKRLLIYFKQLLEDNYEKGGGVQSVEIKLPMPKCQLAARLAMKPETLSRILAELKQKGIIHMSSRKILINNVEEFMKLAV
ncbi:Crp/Fnr family transcriptional regulator [Nitrincola nitratireducens]|uniref:Fumarate and nitrate reduction regulatory protein n=1 Tax=Nitrincola nitratireducens TaxID=1229521 RepID=W9V099_9GAMM|nr:Crp/Fnr family transcriptional regulator [Nitrincola nitratireducens]EXJ09562.1 Fumarate and nitrate reduction regulatory protein [Nitrincola nitratireducens]